MKKRWRLALILAAAAVAGYGAELRLTSPDGGEEICLGRPFRITWAASGIRQRLKLVLIRSGGARVGVIADNLDAAALGWDWSSAGLHANGTAAEGNDYKIRVITADEETWDLSNSPFSLKNCGSSTLQDKIQAEPIRTLPQFSKAEQPQFEIKKAPKLQVRELEYDYRTEHFHAWVKNTGNAPFVGHFRWQWITDCGANEANKDIPPSQSALLETSRGMSLRFPCAPRGGSCSMHACFTIEPVEMDGTRHEYSRLEGDFPCFEHSQFLMCDSRILVRFLHGQHWVNCSQEYVIGPSDAFDYDPAGKTATFFVGIPVRNCGSEAGRKDHLENRKLHWSVFHIPSDTYALPLQSVSNGTFYSGAPIAPGQGLLVERALTLKVRSGIYMLHVYGGPDTTGLQFCVISLRFADSLIH